jgi:hypothetical protein
MTDSEWPRAADSRPRRPKDNDVFAEHAVYRSATVELPNQPPSAVVQMELDGVVISGRRTKTSLFKPAMVREMIQRLAEAADLAEQQERELRHET